MPSDVLATGGIEVPRLLLAANRQRTAGIGNAHDLVGRYFMEHPHLDLPGVLFASRESLSHFDKRTYEMRPGEHAVESTIGIAALTLTPEAQERHRVGGFSTLLVPLLLERDDEPAVTPFAASGLLRAGEKADNGSLAIVGVRSEQVPNRDSLVRLGTGRDALGLPLVELEWRTSELDRETIRVGVDAVAHALGARGLGRVQVDISGPDGKAPDLGIGFHHMGTARMHADPARGVVDATCRVHDVDNLFVAGSAVFPTAGYSNPTLTLVALALRLADHLRGKVLR